MHAPTWHGGMQMEGMEAALDEDTQVALDGIVGQYQFSDKVLHIFEELVGT